MLPEGMNKSIIMCRNNNLLFKAIKKGKKVLGKIVSFCPDTQIFTVVLTQFDSIIAHMDGKFANRSMVGNTIECIVQNDEKNELTCYRDVTEATNWCITNYKVGDVILGKLVAFNCNGAIIDIGGGCTGFLHICNTIEGVTHVSEFLKLGECSKFVIVRIIENKFYLKLNN